MDRIGDILDGLGARWQAWEGIPDLPLPEPVDPSVLLVVATVLFGLGLMGVVTAWVDRRFSLVSLLLLLLSFVIYVWVWDGDRDGVTLISVPHAFVDVIARILR